MLRKFFGSQETDDIEMAIPSQGVRKDVERTVRPIAQLRRQVVVPEASPLPLIPYTHCITAVGPPVNQHSVKRPRSKERTDAPLQPLQHSKSPETTAVGFS